MLFPDDAAERRAAYRKSVQKRPPGTRGIYLKKEAQDYLDGMIADGVHLQLAHSLAAQQNKDLQKAGPGDVANLEDWKTPR